MLAQFNPFGPTGGNPMVKVVEINGVDYWSFYIAIFGNYPPNGVTFSIHQPANNLPGYINYNDAWNACKAFYTQGSDFGGYDMPGYTMDDVGLTYGNENVPGFTFSDQGLAIVADTPVRGFIGTPISGP